MEKHATLTFSNFSAYSVWLEVKHERISEPLIHAGSGVALGCSSPLSLVCRLGWFAELEHSTAQGGF